MKPNKSCKLFLGNQAIARGAVEAGISLAVSYPGTPATEILEDIAANYPTKAHWAVNEKVALETAIGVSYTNRRVLCSMKHVGLNVAADPLMTSAYLGVYGGVVLAVADDPGAYSSQNEQDTRFYSKFAKIPCLEPADAQEAKNMTVQAFELSEKFGLPVILRLVTRLCHTASPVKTGAIRSENTLKVIKDTEKMIAVPSHIMRLHKLLNGKQEALKNWGVKSGLNRVIKNPKKKGIIACGTTFEYAMEYKKDFEILKITYYPFHEELIRNFVKGKKEVLVLEEGEPLIEEIARKFHKNIKGKLSGDISREGEIGPDAIGTYLSGKKAVRKSNLQISLPARPPALCAGCQYRELYTALNAAKPTFVSGDIGCYTLGASPPFKALDTCLCMGAGVSQAAGIASQGVKRVAAVIGDSTFIHSGITGLINSVYNKVNMVLIILDNSTTAMTGHQPTPMTGVNAKGEPGDMIILEELCRSCGAKSVEVLNPNNVEEATRMINEKFDSEGVHVIISRRPCIFAKKNKKTL